MKVTIPFKNETKEIEISDYCPVCGQLRGNPMKQPLILNHRRLMVHVWDNPCGHIDKYEYCINESERIAASKMEESLESQVKRLQYAMEKGGKFTQLDMLYKFGIGNHTGRIADIRKKMGYDYVKTDMIKKNGKRIGLYSIPNPVK